MASTPESPPCRSLAARPAVRRWVSAHTLLLSLAIGSLVAVVLSAYVNVLTGALTDANRRSFAEELRQLKYWHLCILVAVALTAAEIWVARASERRLRVAADDLINRTLEAACKSLTFPRSTRHIRAIVTVREGQTGRRATRYWYQVAADPERTASYPLDFGVTGQAYTTRSVVLQELPSNHMTTYEADIRRAVYPEIRTVMAAPLLASEDGRDQPLGVLAFDSTLPPEKLSFGRPEARDLAQAWADIVARLLIVRGY